MNRAGGDAGIGDHLGRFFVVLRVEEGARQDRKLSRGHIEVVRLLLDKGTCSGELGRGCSIDTDRDRAKRLARNSRACVVVRSARSVGGSSRGLYRLGLGEGRRRGLPRYSLDPRCNAYLILIFVV